MISTCMCAQNPRLRRVKWLERKADLIGLSSDNFETELRISSGMFKENSISLIIREGDTIALR